MDESHILNLYRSVENQAKVHAFTGLPPRLGLRELPSAMGLQMTAYRSHSAGQRYARLWATMWLLYGAEVLDRTALSVALRYSVVHEPLIEGAIVGSVKVDKGGRRRPGFSPCADAQSAALLASYYHETLKVAWSSRDLSVLRPLARECKKNLRGVRTFMYLSTELRMMSGIT